MQPTEVLDVFEQLLKAATHPGIDKVERYSGAVPGVRVRFGWQTDGFLWVKSDGAASVTQSLPSADKFTTTSFLLRFVWDLCNATQPEPFTSWTFATFKGTAVEPSGLQIKTRDGSTVNLRVTSGGQDPDSNPHADYSIPDGVKEWQSQPLAQAALNAG